jgi:hypothetical protein
MANDIVKKKAASTEVDPYEQLGEGAGSFQHIHGNLLRFTKHGVYKDGQGQEEIEEDTRMLAYMLGLKKGFVKWDEGQPVNHILGLVAEGYQPPAREELGDLDQDDWPELNGRPIDPWQFTYYLPMLDEEGELHTFVTSSDGGKQVINDLGKRYGKRRRMKPDEIPIVKLQSTSYIHKKYGETFKPQFKIDGWAKIPQDFDELKAALAGGDDTPAIEEKTVPFAIKRNAKPKVKAKAEAPARGGKKKGTRF